MSQPDSELSANALPKALGLDRRLIGRDIKRGMPRTLSGAREWRALHVRPRNRPEQEATCTGGHDDDIRPKSNVVDLYGTEIGAEQLEDTIPRLRRLEKATALALERAIKADNVTAAVALRREHCTALKTLYGAEEKLIKIQQTRGKLVSIERALSMINEALRAPVLLLRRLPDLARTPEERPRLEAFLNGVLNEMKMGAADGLKRSALPKETSV